VGTGIGLALARGLAERHGGTLTVDSTPGEGATFTLRLLPGRARFDDRPDVVWAEDEGRKPDEGAPIAGEDITDVSIAGAFIAGEEGADVSIAVEGVAGEGVAGERPEAYDDRPTVLVVDDNADIRAFVRRHLAPAYRVVEAADGRAGLEAARRLTPDVVVSDVMMPRMDGRALLAALRADPATDFLPVVLLTARAAPEDKLDGLEAGADDYLTKPFRPAELRARVRNLLAQRMRLRERFLAERDAVERDAVERDTVERDTVERDDAERDDAKRDDAEQDDAARGDAERGDGAAPSPEADGEEGAAARSPFLRAVEAAIRAHLADEDFGVADLAAAVGVSRSKLYRDLRAVTDASPADLIWRVRVEAGRQLLAAGEGTVSEVAYGVGFKSVAHFSRRFREHHGTAPSEVTPAA
jgi:DNA-binding response OmpR family regulator/AraC-like DNA-binding protein